MWAAEMGLPPRADRTNADLAGGALSAAHLGSTAESSSRICSLVFFARRLLQAARVCPLYSKRAAP